VIARKSVQVFKSHLDDRYGVYSVTTHDGGAVEALPVDSSAEVARLVRAGSEVVAIDEAQFLDHAIVDVCTALAARGLRVIVAGTETDFRGAPFGPMPQLLAVAEQVDKLHAICMQCGNPATRNQRLIDGRPARFDSPTIMIGGSETYEARCRHCHEVPRVDEDQASLL
jgi:thymidine kinase